MGYFSNGTEGLMYQEDYCDRCVHDADQSCPIWNAHLIFNYEGEGSKASSILDMLIPRSADKLGNEKCRMFIAKAADRDLFEDGANA